MGDPTFFVVSNDLTTLSVRMQGDDPVHAKEWRLVGVGVRRLLDIALRTLPAPCCPVCGDDLTTEGRCASCDAFMADEFDRVTAADERWEAEQAFARVKS